MDLKKLASKKITTPQGKFPTKTTINLAYKEQDRNQQIVRAVTWVIIAAALIVAVKFLVFNQLQKVNTAENEYNAAVEQLTALQKSNSKYSSVNAEYVHYGAGDLNDDELHRQDREAMMKVIDKYVNVDSGIQSIEITDNTAKLTIERTTLREVSDVVSGLQKSEIVQSVSPSTASNEDYDGAVTAEITVTFVDPAGDTSSTESSDDESLTDKLGDRKIQSESEGTTNE